MIKKTFYVLKISLKILKEFFKKNEDIILIILKTKNIFKVFHNNSKYQNDFIAKMYAYVKCYQKNFFVKDHSRKVTRTTYNIWPHLIFNISSFVPSFSYNFQLCSTQL